MESCQTQTHIHMDSPSINDDSNNEALEDFLSHLEMRIHRMISLLTRSDQFFVDQLITFIHTPSYPEHSIHIFMSYLGMNQNIDSCA